MTNIDFFHLLPNYTADSLYSAQAKYSIEIYNLEKYWNAN